MRLFTPAVWLTSRGTQTRAGVLPKNIWHRSHVTTVTSLLVQFLYVFTAKRTALQRWKIVQCEYCTWTLTVSLPWAKRGRTWGDDEAERTYHSVIPRPLPSHRSSSSSAVAQPTEWLATASYTVHVASVFRRKVDDICDLPGCYAASSGNSLSTFRDMSVPSSSAKQIQEVTSGRW